jgi:hypothetical protein
MTHQAAPSTYDIVYEYIQKRRKTPGYQHADDPKTFRDAVIVAVVGKPISLRVDEIEEILQQLAEEAQQYSNTHRAYLHPSNYTETFAIIKFVLDQVKEPDHSLIANPSDGIN